MNTQESEMDFGRSEEATIFVRYSAVPRDMLLSKTGPRKQGPQREPGRVKSNDVRSI